MPVVLIILDGFGLSPDQTFNGIAQARTPMLDYLLATYPHSLLEASEEYVGLPKGQMGNSEVGHLTLGAGRIVRQGLSAIDHAISVSDFQKNPQLLTFIKNSKTKRCHLMGLFSDGGVHAHMHHFNEAAKILIDQGITVFMHLFTDGRDTPPKDALRFIDLLPKHPLLVPATLQGRFYAMDRDHRWDRTELAYRAIIKGEGKRVASFQEAIQQSYDDNITDEFIKPCVMGDYQGVLPGDSLFHTHFRADRVRQLLGALVLPGFSDFSRELVSWSATLGMSSYSNALDAFVPALYKAEPVRNGFVQILSQHHKKILKIAETEKYAHVTFFFNGGIEEPVAGEDRILVPSPKVATYDLAPEMSARDITEKLCAAIASKTYDAIIVNFANPDMVGHTGVQEAILQAIECIDTCLETIYKHICNADYTLMITADHGNAEQMVEDHNPDKPHTAHTCNPVPCLLVNSSYRAIKNGTLADVAPTLLKIMEIPLPDTMTGVPLVK